MALNFLKKHLKQFSSNQTCCPGGSLLLVGTCLKCHLEPLLISITLMMVKMIGMAMIVLIPARVALNIVLPKRAQPVWKIWWTLRGCCVATCFMPLICFHFSDIQYSLKLSDVSMRWNIIYHLTIEIFYKSCYSLCIYTLERMVIRKFFPKP